MTTYKWVRTNLNDNVYKYYFTNSSQERLSWKVVLELLKNKDQNFFPVFQLALVDANNKSFPYLWNCSPVSKTGLDKSFEFVVKKSSGLENISPNYSAFQTHINQSSDPEVTSFLNLDRTSTLVIPMPASGLFSDISRFTKNASLQQQERFWQGVANELTKELNKNGETKWLNTHGTGVYWLHARIDPSPKYYFFEDYKNPNYTPNPTPRTPKEKILANLDKICLDPLGAFANSQAVEKNWTWGEYYDEGEAEKHGQYKITDQNGEEINLKFYLSFEDQERDKLHKEIRTAIINNIKQNPQDWEIYSDGSNSQKGNFIKNKKTNVKHYKSGFTIFEEKINGEWDEEIGKRDWAEIKNALKNSPNKNPKQTEKKWYNPTDYPLPWIAVLLSALLIVITTTFWKRTKRKF